MSKPEFEPEYYLAQIDLMTERYSSVLKSWGMSWERFFDPVERRLSGRDYYKWVFLCGLDPVLREASLLQGKKQRHEFLAESSRKRLMDICLDDDRLGFFLKNI